MNETPNKARGLFYKRNIKLLFLTQYQTSYDGTYKYIRKWHRSQTTTSPRNSSTLCSVPTAWASSSKEQDQQLLVVNLEPF